MARDRDAAGLSNPWIQNIPHILLVQRMGLMGLELGLGCGEEISVRIFAGRNGAAFI